MIESSTERPVGLSRQLVLHLLLLALLVALFLGHLLADALDRLFRGDLRVLGIPYRVAARDALRGGRMPFWDPFTLGGSQPFIARYDPGVFYLPNLLLDWAGPGFAEPARTDFGQVYRVVIASQAVHVFMAAVFMYVLMMCLKVRPFAALVAGFAFGFSGHILSFLDTPNVMGNAVWLPLVFALYLRAVDGPVAFWAARRAMACVILAGLALGIALTAGYPQPIFYLPFLMLIHGVCASARRRRSGADFPGALEPLAGAALILALGCGFAALQLLPTFEFLGHSARQDLARDQALIGSLDPKLLMSVLSPDFFAKFKPFPWESATPVGKPEADYYVGLLPLLFAAMAFVGRRRREAWFFAVAGALFLLLSFGKHTVLAEWLRGLPPWGRLRSPGKMWGIVLLCLCVLVGLGCDVFVGALAEREKRRYRRFCRGLVITLACVLLLILPAGYGALLLCYGGERHEAADGAINSLALSTVFLALGVALVLARARFKPHAALRLLAMGLMAVDVFTFQRAGILRISPRDGAQPDTFYALPSPAALIPQQPEPFRVAGVPTHLGLVHGVQGVFGYSTNFYHQRYVRYVQQSNMASPMYDLLNVRYVVTPTKLDERTDLGGKFTRVAEGLYQNRHALPRAWVVPGVRVAGSPAEALALLKAASFNPAREVIVEGQPRINHSPGTESSSAQAQVVRFAAERMEVECELTAAGFLVLSEVWFPGWKAWVDGREQRILRANYLFRAVQLPPDTHRVEFAYQPSPFKLGAAISLSTLAVLLAALTLALTSRKGKRALAIPLA